MTLEDTHTVPKQVQKSFRAVAYKEECFSLQLSETCISQGKGKIQSTYARVIFPPAFYREYSNILFQSPSQMLVLKNNAVKTELPKVWSAPSRTSRIRADEGSWMDIHVILDCEVGKHHSTCSVLPFTLSVTISCKRSSMCSILTECVRRTS